jgi:lincosamide nucleotidyltransferase A/C/D/E
VLDDQGDGICGPPEKREKYPAASLTGTGNIDGQAVRCVSPEWMVKFHSGYDLRDKDFRDVSALCKKFGIELPAGIRTAQGAHFKAILNRIGILVRCS